MRTILQRLTAKSMNTSQFLVVLLAVFAVCSLAAEEDQFYSENSIKDLVENSVDGYTENYDVKEFEELNVIDGTKAENGQFPFMALVISSIKYNGKNVTRQCGGVIYNTNWILTSAQCTSFLLDPKAVNVYVGDVQFSKMQKMAVRKIYIYPDFTTKSYSYDIALLQLKDSLTFNSRIKAVTLGKGKAKSGTFLIPGWGVRNSKTTARSTTLFYTTQKFVAPKSCKKVFKSGRRNFHPQTHFCTKSKAGSLCAGDAGGPLIQTKNPNKPNGALLYGLASFGNGCSSKFNANTRIDTFSCWINDTVAGVIPNSPPNNANGGKKNKKNKKNKNRKNGKKNGKKNRKNNGKKNGKRNGKGGGITLGRRGSKLQFDASLQNLQSLKSECLNADVSACSQLSHCRWEPSYSLCFSQCNSLLDSFQCHAQADCLWSNNECSSLQ